MSTSFIPIELAIGFVGLSRSVGPGFGRSAGSQGAAGAVARFTTGGEAVPSTALPDAPGLSTPERARRSSASPFTACEAARGTNRTVNSSFPPAWTVTSSPDDSSPSFFTLTLCLPAVTERNARLAAARPGDGDLLAVDEDLGIFREVHQLDDPFEVLTLITTAQATKNASSNTPTATDGHEPRRPPRRCEGRRLVS